jgi:hypothetical protein
MERASSRTGVVRYAALWLLLAGSGCATITGGARDQEIKITSNPEGAAVLADGKPLGVTPAVVKLGHKTEHTVLIACPGYEPVQVALRPRLNPWVFGNLFIGGLIGLTVDICTDAVYELSPDQVVVNLRPLATPTVQVVPPDR